MPPSDKDSSSFGKRCFDEEEEKEISRQLLAKLEKEETSKRSGGGGSTLTYIDGWRSIAYANQIFGFNGWSSEIISHEQLYCGVGSSGTYVGYSCRVRITLRDGTYKEDIGFGSAEGRILPICYDKAIKEAATDAIKRALRQFGEKLGLSLYDKDHLAYLDSQETKTKTKQDTKATFVPASIHHKKLQSINPSKEKQCIPVQKERLPLTRKSVEDKSDLDF